MKRILVLICALLMAMSSAAAQAEYYGIAAIDGITSDRVHLRSGPSVIAESLGLYFSGTNALCLSSPFDEWVCVQIGQCTGYMMSRYLIHESAGIAAGRVQYPMEVSNIAAYSWVNLRQSPDPDGKVLKQLKLGERIYLLGETVDGWSYVRTDSWLHGYVMSDYVMAESGTSHSGSGLTFADLPSEWLFTSGAGAWGTELTLYDNGHFEGYYHDANMGETGEYYPAGTVYYAYFSGAFSNPARTGDYTYQLEVDQFKLHQVPGSEEIYDGTCYIASGSAGIHEKAVFTLYIPGTPAWMLPEDFRMWIHSYQGGELKQYALYSQTENLGFDPQ